MRERVEQASTMRASGPTARPAHASPHLIDADLDAPLPGSFLLRGSDPTNPLVSRKWGDVGPQAPGGGVRFDGPPEVSWQLMNRAVSEFSNRHTASMSVPPNENKLSDREPAAAGKLQRVLPSFHNS